MRKLLSSAEIKAIELDILSAIDLFCRQNKIRYSICGGTLLGAVRHQGFIPWDDDIDLLMPRPDYERFLKSFHHDEMTVIDLSEQDDCVETFIKVCKKGTILVDKNFGRELWGVGVDVFPIDGFEASDIKEKYKTVDTTRNTLMQICPYYRAVKGFRRIPLFIKYCLKRLLYFYPGSFCSLKKVVTNTQKAYPYESSPIVGVFYWVEKDRTFLPKNIYEELTELPFEGKYYPATKHYDFYLKQMYGDYMQLPPVEKRVSHHPFNPYIEIE